MSASSLCASPVWECERCTWQNADTALTCGMCYTVRVASKDVDVVWQWLSGDQWIPYDRDTAERIEDAYQRGPRTARTHRTTAHYTGRTARH